MKRILFMAALFLLSAGTASADHVLIKINVNQMNFFPQLPMGNAGVSGAAGATGATGVPGAAGLYGAAGMAGAAGMPGMAGAAGMGGAPPMPFPGAGGNFGLRGAGGAAGRVGFGGQIGGPPPMPQPQPQPDPNNQGGTPMMPTPPEDPNPKWVSAWVNVNFLENKLGAPQPIWAQPGMGFILVSDHKWGKKNWMTVSPMFPAVAVHFKSEPFNRKWDADLNTATKAKVKNVDNFLKLAREALQRGQLKDVHRAMKEAVSTDPNHPVVKTYVRVQKDLSKPFKEDDPTQHELIRELRENNYKPHISVQGHYCIYATYDLTERHVEAAVTRRLALMEESLEAFYYWFTLNAPEVLQSTPPKLGMPRHRLIGLISNGKEEFLTRHQQWGQVPMVADGFTPRRDNIMVLAAKARVKDPVYHEFIKVLNEKIVEANAKLQPYKISISREDLLSGKVNEMKGAGQAAIFIGAAQNAVLLAKALEDEAERATISNEAIRQLLTASGMFPRTVQVPDWAVEGIAAFFETPVGSLYPTIGAPSWNHLISFKHHTRKKAGPEVLINVATDRYFQDARKLEADLLESRDDDDLRLRTRDSWEIARSTSWAFIYYLAQNRKIDLLFQYGKELDTLPRDMDLSDMVMQRSFARAFGMTDTMNPGRIATRPLENMGNSWFAMMQETNLDPIDVQNFYLKERASRETPTGVVPPAKGGNDGGGIKPPMPRPMPPNPNPMTPPVFNPNPMPPVNTTPMPNPMPPMPNPNPAPPVNTNPMPNPGPPPMPNPAPPVNPNQGGLAGSTWSGNENLKDYGALSFQFQQGNQVIMTDKDGQTPGNYNQIGNSITLRFGPVSYSGTINGGTMQGTASNGRDRWNWTVNNPNGATAAPPMPMPRPKGPAR
jgi:hypothetical protein